MGLMRILILMELIIQIHMTLCLRKSCSQKKLTVPNLLLLLILKYLLLLLLLLLP